MGFKYWVLGVLLAWAFFSQVFAADKTPATPEPSSLTIDEVTTPIRVDGHLNDWPAARMILLDQPSQIILGKAFWKGPEDFNGRVFLTYDSACLYVGVIVRKNGGVVSPKDKPSLGNGDCVELFLSTDPHYQNRKRLSGRDYHIGFSPGSECKNPQIYCFNKNRDIAGCRIISRTTQKGYLMEASIPLSFFAGLDLGPGKTAGFNVVLDEGGPVSGNRIVQLAYSGGSFTWDNPAAWGALQWIGKTVVSVPEKHEEDIYAGLVQDGTKGATFLGLKTILGRVLDAKGKPLAGAKVTTWPRSGTALTDPNGNFELKRIKLYNKSVFYGGKDGYAASLAPLVGKGGPVTLRLQALPPGFDPQTGQPSPYFTGQTLQLPSQGGLDAATSMTSDWVKPLQLKILRLSGMERAEQTPGSERPILDQFVAYTREMGAEPMIEVPVTEENPEKAAEWVRYCNGVKGYKVQFWTIGDEPDLYSAVGSDARFKDYNVYNYVNDFRVMVNAMKTADPTIFILGPELAWKYIEQEDDWLTPFIRYNGDIVNMASIHHYAASKAEQCTLKTIQDDLRQEAAMFHGLRDKISQNSDISIPLVVTGGNVCSREVTAQTANGTGPDRFWSVLWEAEETGFALQENLGMNLRSYLKGNGALDLLTGAGPQPAYAVMKLLNSTSRGKSIQCHINQPNVSVWAIQDPQTKDVNLFVVNEADHYFQTKISFNGKGDALVVDAGLNQEFRYEIPSFSVACLKIKADHSNGEAALYTRKMALAGKGPETSVIKPW